MDFTRRETLALSAGAAAAALLPVSAFAQAAADAEMVGSAEEFLAGATAAEGELNLTAPEIAENGNTVPVSIEVESARSGDDLCESVMILADGNPNPDVCTFHFTEMSGSATATTRMRLAKTQNVIAVAKMKDGSVFMDKKEVKVTIGGCGG